MSSKASQRNTMVKRKHGYWSIVDDTVIDIDKLITEFTKVFPDFVVSCKNKEKSQSLGFADNIIWSISRQAAKLANTPEDKRWRLRTSETTSVDVLSYKSGTEPTDAPEFKDGRLILSVKQAVLLALIKLQEVIEYHTPTANANYLLSPLAETIFDKEHIDKLATELNTTPTNVLVAINLSVYDGCHYLPASECHIAVIAAQFKTRAVKENKLLRDSIISKVKEQYLACGKKFDVEKYNIYSKYTLYDVIDDMVKRCREIFESCHGLTKEIPSTSSKNSN